MKEINIKPSLYVHTQLAVITVKPHTIIQDETHAYIVVIINIRLCAKHHGCNGQVHRHRIRSFQKQSTQHQGKQHI